MAFVIALLVGLLLIVAVVSVAAIFWFLLLAALAAGGAFVLYVLLTAATGDTIYAMGLTVLIIGIGVAYLANRDTPPEKEETPVQ